jgi:hypothetical protein
MHKSDMIDCRRRWRPHAYGNITPSHEGDLTDPAVAGVFKLLHGNVVNFFMTRWVGY